MNTGFPSYAGSPWTDRHDDYSPDSGFDSAYSSTFGSTGSRLGSSQDVGIHSGSKFGEFVHGKSPSWPMAQVMGRPSPGHAFPSSRSTSWPGQMKMENDMRLNSTKSSFGVTGEKYRDKVSDVTCPGDRTDNSWCDLVSRATHKEETLSPESARRIFREATARNERLRTDRYSTSFLQSTPEKPHKVFLHPSPSVVDKSYATSKASGYNSLYGDGMGSCSSPSLKELNDLASCRRRITLPREHTSSYETFNCPQGIQKPGSNEMDSLSSGGTMGQFGLRSQVSHSASSQTDWQNNNTSHRISGAPLDHQVSPGLGGKHNYTGSVRDFNHPSVDFSKLATPVQLQRQGSDWKEMHVRSDHSPGASPRGLVLARAAQIGRNDALVQTLRSPNEGAYPTLAMSESLPKTHDDPDCLGGSESKKLSCSGTPVVQQLERLSLSRTSILRKLSHEFYGQSAKHSPGLANHAILGTKRYRRFGSVDETSPVSCSTPDSSRCPSDEDSRSLFFKPCQNGNGVSPSGDPEGFTTVGVIATAVSPSTGCYLPSVPEMNIGPVDGQDLGSSYHLETHFHKPKPDQRFEKITPVSFDDRNIADSPPPPDLPPRKYLENGDVKSKSISTDVQGQGLELLGANDDNFDSAADDYAEQLRRQAKRLSHSHSSIFTSSHSPKVEQVALPGGHVRKLVDHVNQEINSSKSTGFVVASILSPRVKPVLLQSGTSPNASHCEVVPNVRHAVTVPSSSDDTVNGCNESPGIGKVHAGVATRKTGKTSCSKKLFDSNTGPGEKGFVSDWIISVQNSDQERNTVSYVRSLSSPENHGLGPKVNDSRNEGKSLSMERKSYKEKNSHGERNHLGHAGNSSALEAAGLGNDGIDSRADRKFSNKESNSSSHERNSSSHERNSSSHERNSSSHERNSSNHEKNSSSQERKSASQERKSMSQERNTLSCRGNSSGPGEHTSNRGRKNLNEERGGINCQRNHSNEERRILGQERNSSCEERHGHNTNKNVASNQERSLSHERKTGDSERHSVIKTRKDLNHELHAAIYGNDINGTIQAGKCRSSEKKSLSEESPSHKRRSACDESVKNLEKNVEKKAAPPNTSKREFSDRGSHMDNSILHAPRNKSKEKICKMENAVNGTEPHWDSNFKEETPTVKVTELKLVISTSSDADITGTKPLNSIIKMVSAKKMKQGNPVSVYDSEVSMAKTKLVHSSLEGKAVIREKPVVSDANVKPVSAICENDTAVKVWALLNSKCGTALAKIQGNFNPNSSHVQEEIPSFLSDVLPKEHKTATCYLARLSFNNILTKNVEHETCLPAVRTSIQPYLRYLTEKAVASSSSSENQESSSVHSKLKQVDDKLKDFEREKLSIENEAIENVALGHKLTSLAEQKLEPKEFGKYKLYVDEMDKVLCLLLNVTKRLSSVETSIKSLPADGSADEKSVLVSKRDDLSQKYEDALALSEGIALRRHQVADYLVKCLSAEELKSFEHFVEAKLRLFLEKQAVEDIITIIQSKLQLLNSDGAV